MDTSKRPDGMAEVKIFDTADELFGLFARAESVELNRIQEPFFYHVFLPFFAEGHNPIYPNVNLQMWLNISHSPYNEVIVTDTAGVEIYRVPPLCDKSSFKPLDGKGADRTMPTIFDMTQTAMAIGKQGYGAMMNYFTNELKRRDFMFVKTPDSEAIVQRWDAILARYGYKTNNPAKAEGSPANGSRPADFDSQDFIPL